MQLLRETKELSRRQFVADTVTKCSWSSSLLSSLCGYIHLYVSGWQAFCLRYAFVVYLKVGKLFVTVCLYIRAFLSEVCMSQVGKLLAICCKSIVVDGSN